ncbi:hypothetical protein AURDEDRAFT_164217 [Auricularia subglabra TFB-10046 SS5]|nr:hypothetical protein AURDEDRAFT_164217 [Auricularia subglabra TFB-10046 SS5]
MASIILTIFIFALAQVLLQFRVYVIYSRSRIILWTNIALFVLEIGISTFVFIHLFSRANLICQTATCSAYPPSFGLVYVAPLIYESYLLALAGYKAWAQRESFRSLGPANILEVLIRGSVIYFALVASAIAMAIITFFAAPQYVDWLDLLSDTMASIGGTRLILSTRQAVTQPRLPTQASITLCNSQSSYNGRNAWRRLSNAESPEGKRGTDRTASYLARALE